MVEQKKIPFLFGEDELSPADLAVYSQLVRMDFNRMRELQVEFEKLKGSKNDQVLTKLNNPHYLLTRGVLGETAEALEALVDPEQGMTSESFKSEVVDILVFIGSLLNHVGIDQAELRQRLLERLNQNTEINLQEIFETAIVTEANAAVQLLIAIGPSSPLFQDKLVDLAHLALQALERMRISPAELNYRFAQVVVKNFIKYRPEVVAKHSLKGGMGASRKNFKKSKFVPITDANVAEKQASWAEKDREFASRQPDLESVAAMAVQIPISA